MASRRGPRAVVAFTEPVLLEKIYRAERPDINVIRVWARPGAIVLSQEFQFLWRYVLALVCAVLFHTVSVLGRKLLVGMDKSLICGGQYWDRTSGPCRVKAVLYR